MPFIVAENEGRSTTMMDVYNKTFSYKYPLRLDIRPGSKLHNKIVREVMTRARESNTIMSARYSSWKEIDEVLTAYISPDEKERVLKQSDARKPVSIVVPQQYAIMEILLTYLTAAMLEEPIFRYEGVGPEDVYGAILLERLIAQQAYYSKMGLSLHTALRDNCAYGLAACAPIWTVEKSIVTRKKQSIFDTILGREGTRKTSEEVTTFEGNRIETIDPYLFLPDVSVPIDRASEGEYIGWITRRTIVSLLKEERNNESIFNARYIALSDGATSVLNNSQSGRNTRTGIDSTMTSRSKLADTIYMYIDIIPRDWGLPGGPFNVNGEYPETWLFGVTGDTIVTTCQRLNLNHGKKPVVTISSDYDGYSIAPVSRLEIVQGLQTVLNWMFNSHVTNVRKAINDMLVVDPSLVNLSDVKNPEPGKIIRLKRASWGRGVKDAVMQLSVADVTRGNVADASIIMELMKGVSGSVDAISGYRRKTSERVTAEEVRADKIGGLSRLERLAKIVGWMGFHDLGMMLASHTQQLMEEETFVKITGEYADILRREYGITAGRIPVSPIDILVNYDVLVRDGSVPGGNYSEAWTQLLPIILQDPEIRQVKDVNKIINYVLRNSGVKDPYQFDRPVAPVQGPPIQAQVVPPEDVMQQVEAGNLVPLNGGGTYAQ